MEHISQLKVSGVIARVRDDDVARQRVWALGSPSGRAVGRDNREARSKIVDQVVEAAEALLDAERSDQFGHASLVPTNVVAEASFSLQNVRRFGRQHEAEHWATVFAAVGSGTGTSANQFVVDTVQDLIGNVCGRSCKTQVGFSEVRVGLSDRSGRRSQASNHVATDAVVLGTIAIFPRKAGAFFEQVHDSAELVLAAGCEAEVFDVNAWAFDDTAAERVALEHASKVDKALALVRSERGLNGRVSKESGAGARFSGAETGPVDADGRGIVLASSSAVDDG